MEKLLFQLLPKSMFKRNQSPIFDKLISPKERKEGVGTLLIKNRQHLLIEDGFPCYEILTDNNNLSTLTRAKIFATVCLIIVSWKANK